ncbi:CoB--CoM heterodisulfide reductase iron-sulfur subunit A family protein [Phosphitispora sp. TUW77]|uniref:CoB--CoM heterodisulfide reductase iron-sulfur subunit A family protein n=1 Tax=Phosphitispora sp. TUW77 TaxID=3152361 RepID=UPI003AB4EEA6
MQKQRVLVIGGGVAGMTSALEAAANGIEVYLVEKAADIGGWAYTYCCKATENCAKCSACLVPQAKMNVEKNPLITVFRGSEIIGVSGQSGAYNVKVKIGNEKPADIEVGAIIIATGFKPFNAALKGEFGYDRETNVITALELEQAMREKGSLAAAYGNAKRIGFIQCVGSRDLALGNNYCSKVCCMYASKLARLIRSELPDAELTIFYMDFQTFGLGFDEFYRSAKEDDKIQFVRGIPAKIFGFPYERLTVRYANSITGQAIEDKFDLIVLAAAITPGEDTQTLASMLGVETDEHGFFKNTVLEPVETKQSGVFIAGACQSPKDIPQSMEQAKAAAGAAVKFLVQ